MTQTPETFPYPEIPKIVPGTGIECLNTYTDITYLENNNIDKAICQKLRKKDVYETDMHNICNLIVVQKNEQLQEKAVSDDTFQAFKTL